MTDAPETDPEVLRRTTRGIRRWLLISIALFWAAVLAIVAGMATDARQFVLAGTFAMLVGLVATSITYLFVLLEPLVFVQRGIKTLLAISFADYVGLSVLLLAVTTLGGPFLYARVLTLLLAVALLVYALRSNQRYLFLVAFIVLLGSNLIAI